MVSGTQWPGGDPFLQRQNEPSIAVSSRNRQHLLAGANDYRTVDLSILTDDENGDAWLGVFKSFDGGQSWRSTLLPGCPYNVPECLGSPIRGTGLNAGSDPVVRPGAYGMFFYAFLAFQRGKNPLGTIGVARFIDDNNKEKVTDDPIRYLGTSVAAQGSLTASHDKPWIAVGLPSSEGEQCTIPASGSTPAQRVPAFPVYVAYVTFLNNETTSQIHVATSRDCGQTWRDPVLVSAGSDLVQGASLAIDPVSGAVYAAWRQIGTLRQPDAIYVAKSSQGEDFDDPVKVAEIHPFDQEDEEGTTTGVRTTFGFRTTAYPSIAVDGAGRVYVAWSERAGPVGVSGIAGVPGIKDARIVLSTSLNGRAWTPFSIIDTPAASSTNPSGRGHQLMPSISVNAGKIMVLYFDLQEDATAGQLRCVSAACLATPPELRNAALFDEVRVPVGDLAPAPGQPGKVFGPQIQDVAPPGFTSPLQRRHTMDVRLAQADQPGLGALLSLPFKSTRVSQYPFGVSAVPGSASSPIQQLRFNVPNLPMFGQGRFPFMGDYVDLASASIVPVASAPRNNSGDGEAPAVNWKFNTAPSNAVVFHAAWTDNRDVRPPANGNWTQYTPLITPPQGPPGAACAVGQAGSRNQNIYTSRISQGLFVSSPQTFKQLGTNPAFPAQLLQRGFAIVVQNATTQVRSFRLTIANQPAGGKASFLQTPVPGQPDPQVTLDVKSGARSSASRTVFVTSTDPRASVTVNVVEITAPGGPLVAGGLQDSITLNADATNPNLAADPTATDITLREVYSADLTNADLTNSTPVNADLTNADLTNADLTNADLTNADLTNLGLPNADPTNADLTNADLTNADLTNADLTNGAIGDTTFKITNNGNTAAVYKINVLTRLLPAGFKSQLVLYKVYKTPQLLRSCSVQEVGQIVVIANIPNPQLNPPNPGNADLTNADLTNSTMALAPSETGYVTYRVVDPNKNASPNICGSAGFPPCGPTDFNPTTAVKIVAVPQAISTGATAPEIPVVITTFTLNDGVRGTLYAQPVQFIGGTAPLLWSIAFGTLPPGLTINPQTGLISGTPTTTGSYTFTVQVLDSATPRQNDTQTLTIRIFDPLAIAATSFSDGVTGAPYSQTVLVTGGFNPALSLAGPLPPGLVFNAAAGQIFGIPTVTGSFPFAITATDSATPPQVPVTKSFTIRIFAPLVFVTTTLPDGATGVPYPPQTIITAGGFNPVLSIPGTLPPGLAFDPNTRQIAGTPTASGVFTFTVSATDAAIPPQAAARIFTIRVASRTSLALVALDNGTASVIDLSTNTVRANLTVGSVPIGSTITADGQLGIVANFAGGTLSFIDLAANPPVGSGTALTTAPAVGAPESTAVTPDGRFAVVADGGTTLVSVVVAVDLVSRTIVSTSAVLPGNTGVAIGPAGAGGSRVVLVPSSLTNQVSVLTLSLAGTLTDTLQRVNLPPLSGARSITITPDGNRALVTNLNINSVSVLAIAGTTVTALSTIPIAGSGTSGIVVTPDGRKAYVSNASSSDIAVLGIDANDNVTDTHRIIPVPAGTPDTFFGVPGLAVTADGTRLLISSVHTNQLSMVDVASDTLLPTTIPLPGKPAGVAVQGGR